MARLNTVNVIERTEESLYSVRSFADDEVGNKEAEELFINIIKEKEETDDMNYIGDYIDEGFYESDNYELALVHS